MNAPGRGGSVLPSRTSGRGWLSQGAGLHSCSFFIVRITTAGRLFAVRERVFIDPRLECLEKHRPYAFVIWADIGDQVKKKSIGSGLAS
jgi:hypothetical protein